MSIFTKRKKTCGITEAEYTQLYSAISSEYYKARQRQKPGASAPSNYMRGLLFAMNLMVQLNAHTIK